MKRKLSPTEHWTIARLAYWNLDRGRWAEAEKLARGLLILDQRDGLAWLYYGEARRQQQDLPEAARAYGEAVKSLQDRPDIWLKLALCLAELGQYDQARRALETARDHSGADPVIGRRIDAVATAIAPG